MSLHHQMQNLKYTKTLEIQKNKISLKTADGILVVPVYEIQYVQAYGNYTKVYVTGQMRFLLISNTLSFFEKKFSESGFLRIHYSLLVNAVWIKSVNLKSPPFVVLKSGIQLTVAQRRKQAVEQFMLEFTDSIK